ncbi:hypothetical protein HMPREF0569_1938 [Micrococcus luteus SK58]|nr:hypothetical protein HMPREF0569_1938 [Micrococcus luteus SK58]
MVVEEHGGPFAAGDVAARRACHPTACSLREHGVPPGNTCVPDCTRT